MGTVDNTFGVLLIGVVVAAVLYGVTCVQTWYYATQYASDPWYHKLLVSAVFFSDSIHQVLITYTVYRYLVTGFGMTSSLKTNMGSLIIALFFTGLTAVMVQCFLVVRIYRLSKKNGLLITASVLLLVVGEFVVHILFTARAFSTAGQSAELKYLSICINSLAAAIDIVIAACLCTLLQQARTGFRKTNTAIRKLVLFSINTGLLTSICALMALIAIVTWPEHFISVALYSCIGRLYCNSLLATLNARQGIRSEFSQDAVDISLSLQGASSAMATQRNNISIKIDTQRDYARDGYSPARDMKDTQAG